MKTIRNTSSGISYTKRWYSGLRTRISTSAILTGIAILFFIIGEQKSFSQGVGISEVSITPDASSILELRSTLRGLLSPRMTSAQRDAILAPATGLIIYNTTTNTFNYYNGSSWIAILNTGTGVTSINGTLNRISIGGTPTIPVIDIDVNYIGQASINTLGTITNGTWNSTRIGLAYGGTNTDLSGGAAIGDILFANTGTSFARLASVATGNALISGGVGTAPSWGKIGLATHVSGTLQITNGGTGQSTSASAFNALSPITTLGDLIYGSGANTASRLAGNITSTSMVLKQTGTGAVSAAPVWGTLNNADVGLGNVENTALSTWAGSANITTLGTIGSGTWNGGIIGGQYGGTGVNNSARTITLGGNLTTSGAFATTFTVTGATNVTLPTSGTLVNSSVTTLSSLSSIGTITTGTWNGTAIGIAYGGTGQNTANAAFNALSPITTLGDLIYGSAANTASRLTGNITSTSMVLKQTGTGAVSAAPAWGTLNNADVGLGNVENTTLSTWAGSANITTVGTIGSGTWNGGIIGSQYGGTGVNNGGRTITLGGNLTTSGAFATTLTVTGATNVTLPTSGTLINSSVTTLSSLSSIGTITTGTWNGTALGIAYGGTGQTTAQSAINALAGGVTTGQYLRGNGTNVLLSAIQVADIPTLNQNTTGSAAKWTTARDLAGNSVDGSANVPFVNKFIVQGTVDAGLTGAQFLGALNTGLVKNTTSTGVLSIGTAGTDYSAGTAALTTGILKSTTGTGALSIAIAGDFPTLNQNTTGTASNVTGTVAILNGGTGQTTQQSAINVLAGGVTSGQYLRGNGTNVVMSGIQVADVPTLNQNTTGTASNVTGIVAVANGGTGRSSITANNLIYGNGAGNVSLLAPGGTTGALLMNTAAGAPSWSLLSGLPGTAGILPVANGGTGSSTMDLWTLTGNPGTNPANNFVGTTDNNDLVFRANNTERARIESSTGDIKIGDATTGTIKATTELVMREDGDQYGTSILRLRNRNAENGAIYENPHATITLVDFIFKTSTNQRNIRYEARAAFARSGVPSFHLGGASPDVPTLSIGDSYAAFNTGVRIGYYAGSVIPVPPPTALLHLSAGTTTAGTAPLKFTSSAGTVLSSPEDGAVEYDGTNYFVTTGTTRYTLAKTLTATASLAFGSTPSMTSTEQTISVPGAADGDVVILGVPSASNLANSTFTARVSAANTVSVKFNNYSVGALTPGVGTFRVSVLKY